MTTSHCRWILGISLGLIAGQLLSGCANDPSPVGAGLIPGSDLTHADSLVAVATSSSSFTSVPDTVTNIQTTTFMGRSGTTEAWGLVVLNGFDPAFDSIAVQSAELRLKAFSHLGDSLGSFSVSVHRALKNWRTKANRYYNIMEPGSYELSSSSVFSGVVGDTDDISIPLDPALASSWFAEDTTNPNFGIVLEPTNSMVIKGFREPRLYVTYIFPDSTSPDTSVFNVPFGDYGFVLGHPDTSFLQDNAHIQVRAGAAYRGLVGFDTTPLPAFSAVHRALLELTADETAPPDFSSTVRDSLYILFMDELGFVPQLEILGTPSTSTGRKVYTFNVTPFVQYWSQNLGIPRVAIRAFNEKNGVDGFVLYGFGAADPAVRPRLKILYSPTRQ